MIKKTIFFLSLLGGVCNSTYSMPQPEQRRVRFTAAARVTQARNPYRQLEKRRPGRPVRIGGQDERFSSKDYSKMEAALNSPFGNKVCCTIL